MSTAVEVSEIMDEHEAAAFLRCSVRHLFELRKQHKIPFAKIGNKVAYVRSQLLAWIQAGGTNAESVGA